VIVAVLSWKLDITKQVGSTYPRSFLVWAALPVSRSARPPSNGRPSGGYAGRAGCSPSRSCSGDARPDRYVLNAIKSVTKGRRTMAVVTFNSILSRLENTLPSTASMPVLPG